VKWSVRREGRPDVLVSTQALRVLLTTRRCASATLVRRVGETTWQSAAETPCLILSPPAAASSADKAQLSWIDDARTSTLAGALLATPWLRFWARMFDLVFFSYLLHALLDAIAPSFLLNGGVLASLLLPSLLLPLVLTLDALSVSAFGNTPGKAIAGIRVLDLCGATLPLSAQLRRNFKLYWFGLGAELPPVTLVTLFLSFRRARRGAVMRWDVAMNSRVIATQPGAARVWIIATLYLALTLSINILLR
jgi:uncharacterized RDD family membrane protein YckC